MRGLMILVVMLGLFACKRSDDHPAPSTGSQGMATGSAAAPRGQQVAPPAGIDLKAPPADAIKTASGLVYKKLKTNPSGAQPHRNDVVMINYTGWRPSTGETFFSNRGRGTMPLNLAQTAPGFTEALPLLRQGEQAV